MDEMHIARISGRDTLHNECKTSQGSGGKVPNQKPGSFCTSSGGAKICLIIRNL